MPPKKYSKNEVLFDPKSQEQQLAPLKELEIQPSTIETIDRALFEYIDDELDIFCTTNKGFKKVPFIWAGAERAYQIKHNRELRDVNGWLIYPIMSIERTGITKDLAQRGAYYAAAQNINDTKGGSMTVARTIKQDKTANFANADSKRLVLNAVGTGQNNFPRKNSKVVYETITVPIPVYLEVTYTLTVMSEYQQQINEIITPFMTKTGAVNYFVIEKDNHRFEVFLESDYALNNNASALLEDARGYETQINFRVIGYIMGADKNEERPKIVRRENAVEIKIPREHVILGDIPEHVHVSGNVPFYRS
tara:strand:+ start:116 stop:1036 length:921 start_codon:yes stop_codon:yes gene_type:complete